MSLQYYDISIGLSGIQKIAAQGRYIYYYTGTTPLIAGGATPTAAGNQAIKVQAGQSGNTILLMPGQSYRLDDNDKVPTEWILSNFKAAEVITGQVMVGEGDFRDSNTSNTSYVKLDATFANNVRITNTPADRVNVSLDTSQILQIAGQSVNYTNAWADIGNGPVVAQQIFSAASNPNGAWIEFVDFSLVNQQQTPSFIASIIAKATAPATQTDGDVLFVASAAGTSATASGTLAVVNQTQSVRIKVAAGKGLYLNQTGGTASSAVKSVLYTLL